MTKRRRARLTDAAIARLRPRDREYTVWDSRVPGLGVRVRPTGGKSYVLLRRTGRPYRPGLARRGVLERHRRGSPGMPRAPGEPGTGGTGRTEKDVPSFQEFVEGEWKAAHFDRYKPSTRRGVSHILNRRLLPAFGSKPLDRITPAQVRQWFDDFSRTAPGNANNALNQFRQIMKLAVALGHIDADPSRGIRRNLRAALTRFLSRDEIDRLHRALDGQTRKSGRAQADIVRLLLLTGCRKGEIVRLRWSEVRDDMLVLEDSKTGPRRVPLNTQARHILERQPRGESPFVFPSPRDPSRPRDPDLRLWYRVRREAEIEDCRLHDLRHTHASHAVMNGVPVPVVSRLLGHSDVRMTLRYSHLGDRDIEEAAERVGQAIAGMINLENE